MYITETNLLRRNNNFDLLRLAAAVFVFLSHCFGLRQSGPDWLYQVTGHRYVFSDLGLIIFFSISGFLVCRSLVTSRSIKQYLRNRFLRLWPAFAVCTLFTVLVIGMVFTTLSPGDYLSHPQTVNYLLRNSTLLSSTHWLPGVFDGMAINASIWTIPIEVRLYILLVLTYLAFRLRFKQFLLVLTIIAWVTWIIVPIDVKREWFRSHVIRSVNLGLFFQWGACFYLYKEKLPFKLSIWLALFAYWLALHIWFPGYVKGMEHPFFVYSFLWVAMGWKKIPFFRSDISYAFYLYAWPVQLIVHKLYGQQLGLAAYMLIAGSGITLLAILSWHLVEKKALSFKQVIPTRKTLPHVDLTQGPEHKAHGNK